MIKGLDISYYQAGINLDSVVNAGYKFLILRAGFTGWGTGVSYNKDDQFETFYNQAKARGLGVGAYWYSCADNYQKGVNEANWMYENCLKGKQFDYPIYIDVEEPRWQTGKKDGVTQAIKGFCETLENKGYYVGIYASDISGFKDKMNIGDLIAYDKWVARYGSKPKYVTSYGMWQSSSTGRINGYNGNLDTNEAYKDYPAIIKNAGLNGYPKNGGGNTPAPAPTIKPSTELKVGDKVRIIGTGNGSSYGDSNTAGGIGWEREILKVYEGRAFPYRVGNSTGTTGFYKASSLQKL